MYKGQYDPALRMCAEDSGGPDRMFEQCQCLAGGRLWGHCEGCMCLQLGTESYRTDAGEIDHTDCCSGEAENVSAELVEKHRCVYRG